MALLIETIKDKIAMQSSVVYGRRLGLGKEARQIYEMLAGPVGLVKQIEDITTTAATSAAPHGHTQVLTSGSTQLGLYTLQSPIPGIRKTLSLNSTSTGNQQFQLTNATLITATGATGSTMINLKGLGATIELLGLSTSQWQQIGYSSSLAALVLFSTTT